MERSTILEKVNEICRDVFDDETIQINDATTANDIDEWDSLTHLQLIAEIEAEYGIKFSMGEIQGFANLGELIDCIMKKID